MLMLQYGWTALMYACRGWHSEIVASMLVRRGAALWRLEDEKAEEVKKNMSLVEWETSWYS